MKFREALVQVGGTELLGFRQELPKLRKELQLFFLAKFPLVQQSEYLRRSLGPLCRVTRTR